MTVVAATQTSPVGIPSAEYSGCTRCIANPAAVTCSEKVIAHWAKYQGFYSAHDGHPSSRSTYYRHNRPICSHWQVCRLRSYGGFSLQQMLCLHSTHAQHMVACTHRCLPQQCAGSLRLLEAVRVRDVYAAPAAGCLEGAQLCELIC